LSTMSTSTPGNGNVAEPGLVSTTAGGGVIMIIPVSVDHQASTTGQRPPPTVDLVQTHAAGLIGSPTVPSKRRWTGRAWPAGRDHIADLYLAVGHHPPGSISSSTSWQRCSKLAWSRSPRSPCSTWVVDWAIALAWISR
jgi:hypothetical protein